MSEDFQIEHDGQDYVLSCKGVPLARFEEIKPLQSCCSLFQHIAMINSCNSCAMEGV